MIAYNSIPVYNYSYLANALTPSYDAVFTDVIRKVPVWTCDDWIEWFSALKSKYGEAKAKETWSYFWNLGSSVSSGGAGDSRAGSGLAYDSVPLDCRTTNSSFRSFINTYKLNDVVYKGLGKITIPIGYAGDIVNNAADTVKTTSKVLKYAVPTLLVAGTLLLIFWGYNEAKRA